MRSLHLPLLLVTATLSLVVPAPAHADDADPCGWRGPRIVGEPGSVVRGTPGDDVIVTNGAVEVHAGAGTDLVCVTGDRDGVVVRGGRGRDMLSVVDTDAGGAERRVVRVDLATGEVDTPDGAFVASSFQGASVLAEHVVLRGDDGPNALDASGCTSVVHGLGGPDRIAAGAVASDGFDPYFPRGPECSYAAVVDGGAGHDDLSGGRGDDRVLGRAGNDDMIGRQGDDVLRGGPGRDRAVGAEEVDTCLAEVVSRCEP